MNTLLGVSVAIAEAETRLFNLDFQLLFDSVLTLIAVFALFLVASHFLFNPARKMLQDRTKKIQGDLDQAAKDKELAKQSREEYELKLKNVDEETTQILGEARKKALASEAKIVADAKEDAQRIIEHANQEALLEKKKVADDVKQEIISVAALMAGKVVTANMSTQKQEELFQDTLKEIGDETWLS